MVGWIHRACGTHVHYFVQAYRRVYGQNGCLPRMSIANARSTTSCRGQRFDLSRKLVQSFSQCPNQCFSATCPLPPRRDHSKSLQALGAALLVNDTAKGNTPANIDSLKPGKIPDSLGAAGYRNITGIIFRFLAGGIWEKTYSLNSLTGFSQQQRKKAFPMWSKIALGAATDVVAGTGIGMDRLVDREATSCASIFSQYANSGSNASYSSFSQDYANHYNNETKYSLYRNVLYGVAGVLAADSLFSFLY